MVPAAMQLRSFTSNCAAVLLVSLILGAWAQHAHGNKLRHAPAAARVDDEYIVVLKATADVDAKVGRLVPPGLASKLDKFNVGNFRGFSYRATAPGKLDLLNRLLADPDVEFVEENQIFTIAQETVTTQSNATWGLDRINQQTLPLDGTYTYSTNASNVCVFVADTGIRGTHVEFGGRVTTGYSTFGGRGNVDRNGHGTHCAGTIGSATWGVAKNVVLIPVKVLNDQGSGTTAGIVNGVNWVTKARCPRPSGLSVLSMSLGGSASSSLDSAVRAAVTRGIVTVVAAGNSNRDAALGSPARVDVAITVAASNITDTRASFSNFGSIVDIFAPGVAITSTWRTSDTATRSISGTSMAAPHVAGVAALILAKNPTFTPAQVADSIVNSATAGLLGGVPTGTPNRLLLAPV